MIMKVLRKRSTHGTATSLSVWTSASPTHGGARYRQPRLYEELPKPEAKEPRTSTKSREEKQSVEKR